MQNLDQGIGSGTAAADKMHMLHTIKQIDVYKRQGQGVLQLGHNAGNIIERLGVLVGIVQQNRKLADRNACLLYTSPQIAKAINAISGANGQ